MNTSLEFSTNELRRLAERKLGAKAMNDERTNDETDNTSSSGG